MISKSILSRSIRSLLSLGIVVTLPITTLGAIYVWDTNTGAAGAQDGAGTWTAGAGNWFDQTDSLQNQPWVDGNDAVFGAGSGAAGTVTLGSNITVNSLTFNAAGSGSYTLTGSTLTDTTGAITANVNATISSVIAGTAGLTKSGTGTLTLSGSSANTYSGLTTINAGGLTLSKSSGNAVTGDILVNTGGTLTLGASNQIADTSNITVAGGAVTFAQKNETFQSLTLSGSTSTFITGNSTGASTVMVLGAVSVTGGLLTVNSGGIMSAQSVSLTGGGILMGGNLATSLTIGSGGLNLSGQVITMNPGPFTNQVILNGDVTSSGTSGIVKGSGSASNGAINEVQLGGANRNFNITSGTMSISAVITGPGDNLIKQGSGTLSLQNNDTFSGSLIVNGGTAIVDGTGGQLTGVTGLSVAGGTLQDGSSTVASNTTNNRINPAATLSLGGSVGSGKFSLAYGVAGQNLSQTLAALTINQGANNITTNNAVAGTQSLAFTGTGGAGYARTVGGSVNFADSATFTTSFVNAPTAGSSSVSGTGSDAILIGAVLAGADFVAAQAGVLTAAAYTPTGTSAWTAGKNMDVTGSVTATAATPINSLHFAATGPFTVTLTDAQVITSGMILESAAVGANAMTITGGSLTGPAGADLLLLQYNTSGALTINSSIVDNTSATSLTKAGPGTVAISASNPYTGQTYLNEGTLQISANASLGAVTTGTPINFDGGTLATTATMTLDNSGANLRNLILGAGGGTLSPAASTSLTVAGLISGSGSLTKAGTGTLILSNAANTFTGSLILTAGTLQLASGGALGLGTLALNGGTLQPTVAAAATIANPVTLGAGATIPGTNPVTFTGPMTMTTNSTITYNASGTLMINGNLFLSSGVQTGSRQLTFNGSSPTVINGVIANNTVTTSIGNGVTLNGSGSLTLAGVNTYQGRTVTAGGGALIVTQDQNFGAAPAAPMTDAIILAQNGGLLRVESSFTLNPNRNIGIGQTSGGSITGTISVDPGQTFTVPGVVADRTVNADGSAVTGVNSGSLIKAGAGTLALQGQNTYSGNTTVNAGALLVSGSISAPSNPSSAVLIATAATLGLSGSGSISAGTLTLSNNSTLSLEVASLTANTITLSGNASLVQHVNLALNLTADPVDGTVFTLISAATTLGGYSGGARFFVDTNNELDDGSVFTVNSNGFSQQFQINYGDGSSNVTLLAVPEPGALPTLLGSFGLLVGLSRFRRRGIL